jgi:hypothetical protein
VLPTTNQNLLRFTAEIAEKTPFCHPEWSKVPGLRAYSLRPTRAGIACFGHFEKILGDLCVLGGE